MRHQNAARQQLSVFFIKNQHNWVDNSNTSDYTKVRCKDCGLIALQDKGSLLNFVVEGESELASLSCDQLIIKNIIE